MKTRIILILLLTVANCAVAQTVSREKEVPLISTRHQSFAIPFEIRSEDPANMPKEVELIYSTDQGLNWYPFDRVHPDKKQFDFQSQNDGQYWFIFKTYGSDGIAKQPNRQSPMLKVLVDSVPPKLNVIAEQKGTGETLLSWSVEDANLSKNHPQISIAYSDSVSNRTITNPNSWKQIAIDTSNIHSSGNKHYGDVIWWPQRNARSVEIRVEIADSAGNKEVHNQTIMLVNHDVAANDEVAAKVEQIDPQILEKSQKQTQPVFLPGNRVSSVPDVRNLGAEKKNSTERISVEQPKPAPNSPVPLTPPKPLTISPSITKKETITSNSTVVSRPTGVPKPNSKVLLLSEMNKALAAYPPKPKLEEPEIVPSSAESAPIYGGGTESDSSDELFDLENITDPVAETVENEFPQLFDEISSKSDEDAEAVDDIFDFTPKKVEMSPKYGEESNGKPAPEPTFEQNKSNFEFPTLDFPEITAELDSSVPESQPSTPPAKEVEETSAFTGPGVRISKVSLLDSPEGKQVLVKWETDGESWTALGDVRIHIFRAEKLQGPWVPQAVNLKNTGQHSWAVSQIDRTPFYLFVRCERENDRVYDTTHQPIQIPE